MRTRSLLSLTLIAIALAASPLPCEAQLFGKKKKEAANEPPPLAPGQFEWHPERSPSGPLLIVVSIDDQVAYVYRNAVQIARSTVSTGAPGHDTPTGVFTILQKNRDHESSIYKGAKMPNMQRLTWSGIAMHAGELPGYPASHGCIRLPLDFSSKLFEITEMGGTVVITKKAAVPSASTKPATILLASDVEPGSRPAAQFLGQTMWDPRRSPEGPVNFLLSGLDRTLYVYRNGILIGQTPVHIDRPDLPIPAGVFLMLEGVDENAAPVVRGKPARPWATLALDGGAHGNAVQELRARLQIPEDFGKRIYDLAQPGTILLTTPEASTPETRSAAGFTIMRP